MHFINLKLLRHSKRKFIFKMKRLLVVVSVIAAVAGSEENKCPLTKPEKIQECSADERTYSLKEIFKDEEIQHSQAGDSKEEKRKLVLEPVYQTCHQKALRQSLFPGVSPFINWMSFQSPVMFDIPLDIQEYYIYQGDTYMNQITKSILRKSGMKVVFLNKEKGESRIQGHILASWTGVKNHLYQNISAHELTHHWPAAMWRPINLKDQMWMEMERKNQQFPNEGFDFIPQSYVLPRDRMRLSERFKTLGNNSKFLEKNPAKERGEGIKMITRWDEIPEPKTYAFVQEYMNNSHLINGKKYDLRLYVYVKSINPLQAFLYRRGLVRFATAKYSNAEEDFKKENIHLCNTAIQRKYGNPDSPDMKWSLEKLIKYYAKQGIEWEPIWEKIKDAVLKTLIMAEPKILKAKGTVFNKTKYFGGDMIGLDFLIDNNFKPWFLEVNILPSMKKATVLDQSVKGPLQLEAMHLAGVHINCESDKVDEQEILKEFNVTADKLCLDLKYYTINLTDQEKRKHKQFERKFLKESDYAERILENLTPDDVRHLMRHEDDLRVTRLFDQLFPRHDSHNYLRYFDHPRYYNYLFIAWEKKFGQNRARGRAKLRYFWERIMEEERRRQIVPDYDGEEEMEFRRLY